MKIHAAIIFFTLINSLAQAQTIPLNGHSKISTFIPNTLEVITSRESNGQLEVFDLASGKRTRTLHALEKYSELCNKDSKITYPNKEPIPLTVKFVIPRDEKSFYAAIICSGSNSLIKSWINELHTGGLVSGILKIDTDEFTRDENFYGALKDGRYLREEPWATEREAIGNKISVEITRNNNIKITNKTNGSVLVASHPGCDSFLGGISLTSDEKLAAVGSDCGYKGIFVLNTNDGTEYQTTKIKESLTQERKMKADAIAAHNTQQRIFQNQTAEFRKNLKVGDEASLGLVTEIKGNLIKIQTTESQCTQVNYSGGCMNYITNSAEKWFKRDDLYPKK